MYAIFIFLVDKKHIIEILLFGSLVAVAFVFFNEIGTEIGYWARLKNILPFFPNFFASDLTLIPLSGMFVYQYANSWKRFILWNEIWAGLFTFGYYDLVLTNLDIFFYRKPFAVLLDFVLMSIVGLIARSLLIALLRTEAKHGNLTSKLH